MLSRLSQIWSQSVNRKKKTTKKNALNQNRNKCAMSKHGGQRLRKSDATRWTPSESWPCSISTRTWKLPIKKLLAHAQNRINPIHPSPGRVHRHAPFPAWTMDRGELLRFCVWILYFDGTALAGQRTRTECHPPPFLLNGASDSFGFISSVYILSNYGLVGPAL